MGDQVGEESGRFLTGHAPSRECYPKFLEEPHKHKFAVSVDLMVAVARLTMQAVGDSAGSLASSHSCDALGDDHDVRSDFHLYQGN